MVEAEGGNGTVVLKMGKMQKVGEGKVEVEVEVGLQYFEKGFFVDDADD